ncbi:hypothetical protein VP01_1465g1 [Puccinia sorghi]|uniref:Uncharacterized protein n=1 Tax=Puccinia sorghi TaxID=27349 RepID=A0A0L6VLM2_9BASI|nr:hypothetical protein VP01_1465g1 [Puccinia sorghi]
MIKTNSESPQTQWIMTLSNSGRAFFLNKSNEIQLNHIFLKQWTDEIEFSQRGQANIIYTQGKPRTEVSAKHPLFFKAAVVQRELQTIPRKLLPLTKILKCMKALMNLEMNSNLPKLSTSCTRPIEWLFTCIEDSQYIENPSIQMRVSVFQIPHEVPGVDLKLPPSTLPFCNHKKSNHHEYLPLNQSQVKNIYRDYAISTSLPTFIDTYYNICGDVTITIFLSIYQRKL